MTEIKMDTGVKRKSRLAVFEHIEQRQKSPKRKKFRPNRLELDDSSPSESELVIEDDREPIRHKKRPLLIRISEEQLNLRCEWNYCDESFNLWKEFNAHLIDHALVQAEISMCQWNNCDSVLNTSTLMMQHVSYHGYLSKVKNIGQNVLDRNNWPACKQQENFKIPISPEGYSCLWEHCNLVFFTVFDFYSHVEVHVHNNPRVSNETTKEIITCYWQGCNVKFGTKYKLADHLRTHTKEKIIACPTCCTLFSNKTKLSDHRKRQLASSLQSYQCSQCLKLFPTERLLRDHMRSHINHYKCTMCDMTCPKPSILAKHMRFRHIKEKPYKCSVCPKSFVAKHNLDVHLRTHSKEKVMKCDQCDFECRAKSALDNHYEKAHDKICAVYECHCCKKKFRRGGYLTQHLMKIHNYHWPSGHSRFRYRKDQDGIYRLQTVRYESLEVTQEMLKSESMQSTKNNWDVNYKVMCENNGQTNYVVSISANERPKEESIVITITDVDEQGNIVRSEVVESGGVSNVVIDDMSKVTKIEADFETANPVKIRSGQKEGKSLPIVEEDDLHLIKPKKEKKWENNIDKVEGEIKDENVRHFSEEVILNYKNFEIQGP